MPPKIRNLIREPERAGYEVRSIRGSHRKFVRGERTVIVSGSLGDDAKRYQERAVAQAV